MNEYMEIEACMECSARMQTAVQDVFFYAQHAVLFPTAPLFDYEKQGITPSFRVALCRIFRLFDVDRDGYLSDEELNHFQYECFAATLKREDLVGIKAVLYKEQQSKPKLKHAKSKFTLALSWIYATKSTQN